MGRRIRTLLTLAVTSLLFGCADPEYEGNPLIGTWRAEVPTPIGQFNIGRWQFSPDHMRAFGSDVDVDYEISGSIVRVIPRDFGPELELRMVDRNTAKLNTSQFAGLMMGLTIDASIGDVLSLRRVN
jgi:hypothetical protein